MSRDHAPPRSAPIAMDAEAFRRAGHALVDAVATRLAAVPGGAVTRDESPAEVRRLLAADRALPAEGADAVGLLEETVALLFEHSLFNGHPRFFGYITSSPAPIGILADLLAAAVNPNVGAWRLSPIASEMEAQAIRWIAEFLGYPTDGGGVFVSGGNVANLVGFLAGRAAGAGWDIRAGGLAAGAPLRVYASAETHTWLHKAADVAGLGTDSIRWIETDDDLRMSVPALRRAIAEDRAEGRRPLLVVGTAGSVSTGAVDPLRAIADVCADERLWFHVDGAYGALAAPVPGAPADLQGMARADSVAVDPHKWLYAPLEAGCLLVRDAATLRNAFSYHPPYYHFGQAATNYVDCGLQNSRGFRALKVWLALRQVGRNGYVKMIGEDIRLSQHLHSAVGQNPELEAVTQALSISTFRFVPADLRERIGEEVTERYLNTLNQALLERIQSSGEVFVSNAVIRERYVLRACIVNFHTAEADVDALPDIVVRLGRELDAGLRSESGSR